MVANPDITVRREKALDNSGCKSHPGTGSVHPGSNRSGRGDDEFAGAVGVEGRVGDLAIMQAVMEVNAEQAPKPEMQEPTRQ
jgi:hypothetical protein